MLARAAAIPVGSGWTFEPKLDGLDMTHLPPQFRGSPPAGVQLGAERAALDETDRPTSTGSRLGCCTAAPGDRTKAIRV